MSERGAGDVEAADDVVERRAWLALGVATLVFFLVVIDISAVNVAFPSIGEDLDTDETSLSWIISGYNVTVAALLLVAGRLADSWGRRRVFLPGIAVFMLGSILCGLAPNVGVLIGARVVQAIGGAVISPTALAVVLPEFPPSRRSTAIGILGATGGLGGVFGPALGSIVIDLWSWRGIFWINVPICVLVLLVGPRLLRESKNPAATGRIDVIGVPIGTAAIAAVMFAIIGTEQWGPIDLRVPLLFMGGIGLLVALVRRSADHPEPLLELSLFSYRSYRSAVLAVTFYATSFSSGFLVNSLMLQRLWDQPITTTGQALLLAPLLAAVASPVAGRLADRVGHRWILAVGCLLSAAGYGLLVLVIDTTPRVFDVYVPISALVGLGTGLTISTWASAGLSDVAADLFGTANAMLRTTQQVFFAIGVAVVISLLAGSGGSEAVSGYRWSWAFVCAGYVVSAVMVAATFPSGSSTERRTPTSPDPTGVRPGPGVGPAR